MSRLISKNGVHGRIATGWLDTITDICNPVMLAKSIIANHDRMKKNKSLPGSDDWMIYPEMQQELFEAVRSEWCKATGMDSKQFPYAVHQVAKHHNVFRKLPDDEKVHWRQQMKRQLAVEVMA